ncbi:MAG TPA: hypothetical protein VFZ95_04285 [Steroidobacteraceae bacterium]
MSPAARTWLIIALTLSYLATAHFALIHHSTVLAAIATAVLALLFLASIQGPHRTALRAAVAAIGATIVVLVARGAPPVPLLLPPVLIPASIAFMFARTLRAGSTPLVERVARGFHAPAVPDAAILRYARAVTWAWTLLLAAVAAINSALIVNLVPGGIIDIAGFTPRWPASPEAFVWFGNTGTYLLIGGMLAVEFSVRVWRFPDYRFKNPLHFAREARSRMPNIVAALRNG